MAARQSSDERMQRFIHAINSIEGIEACALVTKDGEVIISSLEDTIVASTIGAMSATMLASAEATAGMARLESPDDVVATTPVGAILVMGAGDEMIVSAILMRPANIESVKSQLSEIVRKMGEEV